MLEECSVKKEGQVSLNKKCFTFHSNAQVLFETTPTHAAVYVVVVVAAVVVVVVVVAADTVIKSSFLPGLKLV